LVCVPRTSNQDFIASTECCLATHKVISLSQTSLPLPSRSHVVMKLTTRLQWHNVNRHSQPFTRAGATQHRHPYTHPCTLRTPHRRTSPTAIIGTICNWSPVLTPLHAAACTVPCYHALWHCTQPCTHSHPQSKDCCTQRTPPSSNHDIRHHLQPPVLIPLHAAACTVPCYHALLALYPTMHTLTPSIEGLLHPAYTTIQQS
jgi:hypothetical protein